MLCISLFTNQATIKHSEHGLGDSVEKNHYLSSIHLACSYLGMGSATAG